MLFLFFRISSMHYIDLCSFQEQMKISGGLTKLTVRKIVDSNFGPQRLFIYFGDKVWDAASHRVFARAAFKNKIIGQQ